MAAEVGSDERDIEELCLRLLGHPHPEGPTKRGTLRTPPARIGGSRHPGAARLEIAGECALFTDWPTSSRGSCH